MSNFSQAELKQLLETAIIPPAVNQIEVHPRLPQTTLVDFCQANGIVVTAYSPLARGTGVLDHPSVTALAASKGKTPAQIALRWNVERGVVVIPKSVTPTRIQSNLDLFGFELDESDIEKIRSLNDGHSTSTSPWSLSGRTGNRNKWLAPLISAALWPVFQVVKIDVQKMGRRGFLKWAWMK